MSLSPKLCFVCHVQTYNLAGHLATNHTKCSTCPRWHDPASPISFQTETQTQNQPQTDHETPFGDERCEKCRRLGKTAAPKTPPQTPQTPQTPQGSRVPAGKALMTGFYTRKCGAHRGQKMSRAALAACPQCRVHCIGARH